MEQISLFEFVEDGEKYLPKESTDWKWTFADYPQNKNGLKVFSCFACGGGSTMGYKLAGCDVIGCCEIDPKMNEVYVANHHPKYNYLMDIRDFNAIPNDELPEELFNLDILDGSPPCTTFSMSGKREETWGKEKKFREGQKSQTLDDLSFVFIKTVNKLRPRIVIMENVEGLLLGEAWGYVQRIYKEFSEIGYRLNHWLLKGENMGVPQARHRVFFVAIRNDSTIDPHDIDMSFNYDPVLFGTVRSDTGREINKQSQQYKMLCLAKHGDKNIADVLNRELGKQSCFSDMIVWDEDICCTITGKANIMSPITKARISNADIVHCQTFPEDYNFLNQPVGYICGMSVPPVMIKRIVQRLIEQNVFDGGTK